MDTIYLALSSRAHLRYATVYLSYCEIGGRTRYAEQPRQYRSGTPICHVVSSYSFIFSPITNSMQSLSITFDLNSLIF